MKNNPEKFIVGQKWNHMFYGDVTVSATTTPDGKPLVNVLDDGREENFYEVPAAIVRLDHPKRCKDDHGNVEMLEEIRVDWEDVDDEIIEYIGEGK